MVRTRLADKIRASTVKEMVCKSILKVSSSSLNFFKEFHNNILKFDQKVNMIH
jgi:hypothetical protein